MSEILEQILTNEAQRSSVQLTNIALQQRAFDPWAHEPTA